LSRRQLILFSILLTISVILLSLREQTKLQLSTNLSSVVLFPVKTVTEFLQFLTVSNTRITQLETTINKLQLENAELKKKIPLDTTEFRIKKYELMKAQIVGRDPSNINGFLYVDKGKDKKICINQPVISVNGLVGKIKFVNAYYSIVETIENRGFAVSALDVRTGIHGIIKNKGSLMFEFIRIDDEIATNDSIYTSGMSEIFPEGVLIGSVSRIDSVENPFFKPVHIMPSVKINRLTYVYIILEIESSTSGSSKKNLPGNSQYYSTE